MTTSITLSIHFLTFGLVDRLVLTLYVKGQQHPSLEEPVSAPCETSTEAYPATLKAVLGAEVAFNPNFKTRWTS